MGNTITRLRHHRSRHIHHDVAIPVTIPTPPPDHIDDSASTTSPARADSVPSPPRKPSLDPVPEAIVAATESGMISENLFCSSLPSPVLRQQPRSQSAPEPGRRRVENGYFPAGPGSVESEGSHGQPGHESEVGDGEERRVRCKGMDG